MLPGDFRCNSRASESPTNKRTSVRMTEHPQSDGMLAMGS